MSDSDDLSTPANIPPDSKIEECLRRIVRLAVKGEEDITVNLARSRAEEELGLESGFFKDTAAWKNRSREVISEAVENAESPAKPAPKAATKAGTKRKSDAVEGRRKKAKISSPDDADKTEVSAGNVKGPRNGKKNGKAIDLPASEEESALSEPPEQISEPPTAVSNSQHVEDDDDSDLSSVIDDPPPKKKRQKKSTSPSATKSNPPKSSKPSTKPDKSSKSSIKDRENTLGPDEEEIKRLQSWLLKCGVRKLWHRELAPYSTPKAKIAHLKGMLDDVGMTGRFSAEKAKQIKEARELKAELESAREFNEQWGHEGESGSEEVEGRGRKKGGEKTRGREEKDEEEEDAAPTRRLKPKGLVDFGDSDEESE